MEFSKKLATLAGASHQLIDTTFIASLTSSAMVQSNQEIVQKENEWPSTFLPGRNALFLTIAASIAYEKGISVLYTGVCQTDYSGYPDCREGFIQSQQQTINLAMDTDIVIETPLMNLTKAETVQRMASLGKLDWYADTHTCYKGQRPACGTCPSCKLRLKGFAKAGIKDPLAYAL